MNGGTEMDVREKLVELIQHEVVPYFAERIADLLISNGVTVQEWIPVSERMPEEKVNCIVHYRHAYCDNDDYWAIGMCFYDGEKFQFDQAYKVTHWMPLPPAPEDMK